MSDTLFDPAEYGIPDARPPRARPAAPGVVQLEAPWVVLRRRSTAPIAHLRRRAADLPHDVYVAAGVVMAECGVFGMVLDVPAGQAVPACPRCLEQGGAA